jgi:hypothetical protein
VLNLYRDDKALSRLPTPEATAAVVKDVLSQYRQKDRDLGSIAEQLNEDAVRGDGFSAILTRDVFEQFANAIITIRLRRIRRAIQQLLDGLWGTADAFYLTSSLYEVVEKGLMWSEKTWGGTERMQDTSYVLFKQRVQSLLDQYFPSPVAAGRNG